MAAKMAMEEQMRHEAVNDGQGIVGKNYKRRRFVDRPSSFAIREYLCISILMLYSRF